MKSLLLLLLTTVVLSCAATAQDILPFGVTLGGQAAAKVEGDENAVLAGCAKYNSGSYGACDAATRGNDGNSVNVVGNKNQRVISGGIDNSAAGSHGKFAGSPEVVQLIARGLNASPAIGGAAQGPGLDRLLANVPIRIFGN